MSRRRRIALPGDILHVMARGLDGHPIFADDEDRSAFLELLGANLARSGCTCYAWALMPNHYHLLLRPMKDHAGVLMRRVNGAYARGFNRRHNRRGYLFQDRFKSIATRDFWYFRELVRYVHLNPLRSGLVKDLNALGRYPWTGHRAVLGSASIPWQSVDDLLARFGTSVPEARAAYLEFLGEATGQPSGMGPLAAMDCAEGTSPDTGDCLLDNRVVGEAGRVRQAVRAFELQEQRKRQSLLSRPSLHGIASATASARKITLKALLRRGRADAASRARSEFCRTAREEHGYTLNELGAFLGVTPTGVLRAIGRTSTNR